MQRILIAVMLLAAGGGARAQLPCEADGTATEAHRVVGRIARLDTAIVSTDLDECAERWGSGDRPIDARHATVPYNAIGWQATRVRGGSVPVPSDNVGARKVRRWPPAATPIPPQRPITLDTVIAPEGTGIEITVTARGALRQPIADVPLTFAISGGLFANGTCCVIQRSTAKSGATGVAWVGYAGTDSLLITTPDASPVVVRRDPPRAPVLRVPQLSVPTDSTVLTPPSLVPAAGLLVARSSMSGPIAALDRAFMANEAAAYQNSLSVGPPLSNHYDALTGRYQREIRDGTYPGPLFERGRDVVLRYLAWSRASVFTAPPHNNTGLAGIELLYWLEGNADARMHIWCRAGFDSGTDRYGYLQGQNKGSDPRQAAIALQAQMAAHRIGVPFAACPANVNTTPLASLGSWLAAGQRQIGWIAENWVDADGIVISNAHHDQCGRPECEAYFMSAMLATELLRWVRDVDPDTVALELAQRIMSHLVRVWQTTGRPLGYLTNRAPGTANDLAAFHVWPALVIWQESGNSAFRDFALAHMQAATTAPNQQQAKQWQQVHATRAQSAEALLAGVRWR